MMNIQNMNIGQKGDLIHEVMLSNQALFEEFFVEQKIEHAEVKKWLSYMNQIGFFDKASELDNNVFNVKDKFVFQYHLSNLIVERKVAMDRYHKYMKDITEELKIFTSFDDDPYCGLDFSKDFNPHTCVLL